MNPPEGILAGCCDRVACRADVHRSRVRRQLLRVGGAHRVCALHHQTAHSHEPIPRADRGPRGTAYGGAVLCARLSFPRDYPMSPPKMQFTSKVFHPNGTLHALQHHTECMQCTTTVRSASPSSTHPSTTPPAGHVFMPAASNVGRVRAQVGAVERRAVCRKDPAVRAEPARRCGRTSHQCTIIIAIITDACRAERREPGECGRGCLFRGWGQIVFSPLCMQKLWRENRAQYDRIAAALVKTSLGL